MLQRPALFLFTVLASLGVVSLGGPSSQTTAFPFLPEGSGAAQPPEPDLAQSSPQPGTAPSTQFGPSATGTASSPTSPVLLAPGTQSEDVRVLQRQLQQLGYYNGPIDGAYGPGTQRAVQQFQQRALLPSTGALDQQTWVQMQQPQLWPNVGSSSSPPAANPPGTPSAPGSTAPTATNSNAARQSGSATVPPLVSPNAGSQDSLASSGAASPTPTPEASEASPSAPETTPSSASETTSEPASKPSPETPASQGNGERRLWSFMAALSLMMVLASSILLGHFVWTRTRPRREDSLLIEDEEFLAPPLGADSAYGAASHRVEAGGDSTHSGSGERPAAPIVDVAGTVTGTLMTVGTHQEPSRLARVNITDELMDELHSPESTKRHKAIWELGQRGNSTAVPALLEVMVDADSKERSLILAALSEIGIRTLKPMNRALALSLQDENPEVRKNAIRDLTRVYDLVGQLSQMLGRAAQDPDIEVQETARWALDQLGQMRQLTGTPYRSIPDASGSSSSLPEDGSRSLPS